MFPFTQSRRTGSRPEIPQDRIQEEKQREAERAAKEEEARIQSLRDQGTSESEKKMKRGIEAARALNAGQITPQQYGNILKDLNGNPEPEAMGTNRNPMPFASASLFGSEQARDKLLGFAVKSGKNPWELVTKSVDGTNSILKNIHTELKKKNKEEVVSI